MLPAGEALLSSAALFWIATLEMVFPPPRIPEVLEGSKKLDIRSDARTGFPRAVSWRMVLLSEVDRASGVGCCGVFPASEGLLNFNKPNKLCVLSFPPKVPPAGLGRGMLGLDWGSVGGPVMGGEARAGLACD